MKWPRRFFCCHAPDPSDESFRRQQLPAAMSANGNDAATLTSCNTDRSSASTHWYPAKASRAPHVTASTGSKQSNRLLSSFNFTSLVNQSLLSDVVLGGPVDGLGSSVPTVVGLQLRQLVREVSLGDFLGAGASGGKVLKGTWRGSEVALKLMVSSDPDGLRLTTREALLSRCLSHPHLVQTYAVHVSQLSEQDLDPDSYEPAITFGTGGISCDAAGSSMVNRLLDTNLLTTQDGCEGGMTSSKAPSACDANILSTQSPIATANVQNILQQQATDLAAWTEPPVPFGLESRETAGPSNLALAASVLLAQSKVVTASSAVMAARMPGPMTTSVPEEECGGSCTSLVPPPVHDGVLQLADKKDNPMMTGCPPGALQVMVLPVPEAPCDAADLLPLATCSGPDHILELSSCSSQQPPQRCQRDHGCSSCEALRSPNLTFLAHGGSPKPSGDHTQAATLGPEGSPRLAQQHLAPPTTRSSPALGGLTPPPCTLSSCIPAQPVQLPIEAHHHATTGCNPVSHNKTMAAGANSRPTTDPPPQTPWSPSPTTAASTICFLSELRSLGAYPGCYLTVVMMELCDSGNLLQLIEQHQQERLHTAAAVAMTGGVAAVALSRAPHSATITKAYVKSCCGVGGMGGSRILLQHPHQRSLLPNIMAATWRLYPTAPDSAAATLAPSSVQTAAIDTGQTPSPMWRPSTATVSGGGEPPEGCSIDIHRGSSAGSGTGMGEDHGRRLELLHNALEVAQAMAYLHALGLVHGDLKPANILLRSSYNLIGPVGGSPWLMPGTAAGGAVRMTQSCWGATATAGTTADTAVSAQWKAQEVCSRSSNTVGVSGSGGGGMVRGYCCKIADFGLTNSVKLQLMEGSGGACDMGALAYMAPEVAAGAPYGMPADVYSYGALLWHMVCGVRPYAALHPAQIMVGLAAGELTLDWPPGVEPTLRKIGIACMGPDPASRPTFEHIVRALLKAIKRTATAASSVWSRRAMCGHHCSTLAGVEAALAGIASPAAASMAAAASAVCDAATGTSGARILSPNHLNRPAQVENRGTGSSLEGRSGGSCVDRGGCGVGEDDRARSGGGGGDGGVGRNNGIVYGEEQHRFASGQFAYCVPPGGFLIPTGVTSGRVKPLDASTHGE